MTKYNFTLALVAGLAASGCTATTPDYGPIGSGLTAIGVCLVVYGVVRVLGELVGNDKPAPKPPRSKRRPSKDDDK